MQQVLVLQSFHESAVTGWIGECVDSVRQWCEAQGYAYKFQGDTLFDLLPPWYRDKVGARTPIAADLARLMWIRDELAQAQHELVAWLDADMLVLQPAQLQLTAATSCVFGQEFWVQQKGVQQKGARYYVRKNVHNAYCAFRPHCPVLPFLIEAVQRMVRRVDAAHMAPQFVGPKLLTHLHNTVGFELDARFGALSPELISALLQGDTAPYEQMLAQMPSPLMAANLCASLQDPADADTSKAMQKLIERLLASQ